MKTQIRSDLQIFDPLKKNPLMSKVWHHTRKFWTLLIIVLQLCFVSCDPVFAHSSPALPNVNTCLSLLTTHEDVLSNHSWSKIPEDRILYQDTQITPYAGREFYLSNERDLYKMKLKLEEADVMVGFATNNVWDLAVRRNAKVMVIGDWAKGPLVVQELFFKPLFAIANTPGEFLSFVSLLPLSRPQDSKIPLSEIFKELNSKLTVFITRTHGFESLTQIQYNLFDQIIHRLKKLGLDESHIALFRSYYQSVMEMNLRTEQLKEQFGPFSSKRSGSVFYFYNDLMARYHPDLLIQTGASPEVVFDPFYSFLSSQKAFLRLKHLFAKSTYFVLGSADDPRLYQKLAARFPEQKQRWAFYTSNIFDFLASGHDLVVGLKVKSVLFDIENALKPTTPTQVSLTHTLGLGKEHHFDEIQFNSQTTAEIALNHHAYIGRIMHFPYKNELELIQTLMFDAVTDNQTELYFAPETGMPFFDFNGSLLFGLTDKPEKVVIYLSSPTRDLQLYGDGHGYFPTFPQDRAYLEALFLSLLERYKKIEPRVQAYLDSHYPKGIPNFEDLEPMILPKVLKRPQK